MKNKKVLLTGATGFIGGRLVEQLIIDNNCSVTAVVRDLSRCSRIARFDTVNIVKADLANSDQMDSLIAEVDAVIHLAFDSAAQKNNLSAIESMATLCIKHNKRFVYTSTISVQEPLPDSIINEDVYPKKYTNNYSRRKYEVETLIMKYVVTKNLQGIVLRPTIVFGPYGASWTLRPIQQLCAGKVIVPNNGEGLCNAVYVDDVCQAIVLAAFKENAEYGTYLISSETPVTWKEYFEFYQSILKTNSIIYLSKVEIERANKNLIKKIRIILGDPKKALMWEPLKSFLMSLRYKLPSSTKMFIKDMAHRYRKISPEPIYMPDKSMLHLFSGKCIVDITKAKEKLGYRPAFTLQSAKHNMEQYMRWAFPDRF